MKTIAIAVSLCIVLCTGTVQSAFGAAGVGLVISATPGSFAVRGGTEMPLALKDRVMSTDVLYTNASGRMQVLLDDDSTISLAPDTRLDLITVIPEGRPEFKAHVSKGLARFITGKIVEKNPGGFTVSTPEGTVGIRGTIFAVRCEDKTVTVYVTNSTSGGVEVAGLLVPTGNKMVLRSDAVPTLVPMQPGEAEKVEQQVATGMGGGSVKAVAEGAAGKGEAESAFSVTEAILATNSLQAGVLLDAILPESVSIIQERTAVVTGTLTAYLNTAFGFTANVTTGKISDGWVDFYGLYGGTGTISPTSFAVSNYMTNDTTITAGDAQTSVLQGSVQIVGNELSVIVDNYALNDVIIQHAGGPGSGAGSGTISP